MGTSKSEKAALSDINYLRLPEGTHAVGGAVIGGFSAGAYVLNEVITVESNPQMYVYKDNAALIYAGLIGGGLALGALIGSASPKWKTYYLGNQKIGQISILPDYNVASAAFGLRIRCSL
jgi:hypothetical protein